VLEIDNKATPLHEWDVDILIVHPKKGVQAEFLVCETSADAAAALIWLL
jgi:hypothetical protein